MTESYRLTEGEPEPIRRAKSFLHITSHIPISFTPEQLLVGSPASHPSSTEVDPEFMTSWLESEVELDGRRMSELQAIPLRGNVAFDLDEEDKRELQQDILPYWRKRCIGHFVLNELALHYHDAWEYNQYSGVYLRSIATGLNHTIQDYRAVLAKGLLGLQCEIKERAAELHAAYPNGQDLFARRHIYEAMLLCADAMMMYARRCGEHARDLAVAESDPDRAAELREIARICAKVPAQPAESWHEALQSYRLLHLCTCLFESGLSHSAGRFDQYMLPWLERDLAKGVIDLKRAQELLECFFVAWNERQAIRPLLAARALAGDRTNDKLTIGGVDWRGRDATTRLTTMCLEAHAHVHLKEPNLSIRLHKGTPEELLIRALEVIRLGSGLPQIINDEAIIPSLVANCGVSLVDARDYGDIGCQENATDPNMGRDADAHGMTNIGWFNLSKIIELALWNGVNRMTGRQVGPATGDPRSFTAMDQFMTAVEQQMEYGTRMNVALNNVMEFCYTHYLPMMCHDLMHPGPRRSGIDINAGGCKYNWAGVFGVGLASAADSLAVIDSLIFKTRQLTWDRLLAALESNWEGCEDVRKKCLSAPKYGADDDYADGWARRLLDLFFDAYSRLRTTRGGPTVCGLVSMGFYMPLGATTWASPDGRRAGEPISDSVAPSHFAPALGPTATHRSVTKAIDSLRTPNGITFNQKMSEATLLTPREISKWGDLVRTFIEAGGQSVQYSVVNREALVDAQVHPERYQDLIVRVGGYSARFVDLSKEVQDTIIARAEQELR
jgi:formate C-acetyltransferase